MDILLDSWSVTLGLISSAIWAVITAIHIRQEHAKKKSIFLSFSERINSYFKDIEIHTGQKIQIIDKRIDEFRKELNGLVRKRKIGEHMLNRVNDVINQHIHDTRIMFIRYIFKAYPIDLKDLDFIFADGKVTQVELGILLQRIDGSKHIPEEEKHKIKDKVSRHCIENNRVMTEDDLFREFGIDDKYFLNNKIKVVLYLFPFLTLSLLGTLSWLQGESKAKTEAEIFYGSSEDEMKHDSFFFGAVGFVNHEKFQDFTNKMSDYLNRPDERPIVFQRFEYEDVGPNGKLTKAIDGGNISGVMLNPGGYKTLKDMPKSPLTDNCTMFAMHTVEPNQKTYSSILIATKERFAEYCQKFGCDYHGQDTFDRDTAAIKGYLTNYVSCIGLTSEYSMSGCILPLNYFLTDFGLKKNQIDGMLDFSDDHSLSVARVLQGVYDIAPTYPGVIEDSIRDKLVILYRSPPIPYNSYWFLNSEAPYKEHLKERFRRLDKIFNGNKVPNDMKVDGWKLLSNKKYDEMFGLCKEIIGTKQPRTTVQIRYESDDIRDKELMNGRLQLPTNEYFSSSIWELVSDETADETDLIVMLTLGKVNRRTNTARIDCYISSKDHLDIPKYQNDHFCISPDGGRDSAFQQSISELQKAIAFRIAPKRRIHNSKGKVFSWYEDIDDIKNYKIFNALSEDADDWTLLKKAEYSFEGDKLMFENAKLFGSVVMAIPK